MTELARTGGEPVASGETRAGRRPSTSHAELEDLSFRLFTERGYERTSIDDIAAAAGIGRRTFFRYYPSKSDLVWGDFVTQLDRLRAWLAATDDGVAMMDALRRAVVEFNRLSPDQEPMHRRRLALILGVPDLLASSAVRFVAWRQVVAEFAAARLGQLPDDLLPRVIGSTALGAALAAYEQWLRDDGAELAVLLDEAFSQLAAGFAGSGGLTT